MEDFDLIFIRNLKRRLKLMVKQLEKLEKEIIRSNKTYKARRITPEQIEAAFKFYEDHKDLLEK